MKRQTRVPQGASMYELVRTGHGSIERLARVGLTRDDLGLQVSEAARRAGLAEELLTRRLEAPPV
ncbi:MAG: hypothetical protein IT301_08925 [Dehalococcoidia bacterium]|nr:hypothetical protein [Dehalococcoidia bacterium]